jgi:hypothetical protein
MERDWEILFAIAGALVLTAGGISIILFAM